jgi:hypothetical protein
MKVLRCQKLERTKTSRSMTHRGAGMDGQVAYKIRRKKDGKFSMGTFDFYKDKWTIEFGPNGVMWQSKESLTEHLCRVANRHGYGYMNTTAQKENLKKYYGGCEVVLFTPEDSVKISEFVPKKLFPGRFWRRENECKRDG